MAALILFCVQISLDKTFEERDTLNANIVVSISIEYLIACDLFSFLSNLFCNTNVLTVCIDGMRLHPIWIRLKQQQTTEYRKRRVFHVCCFSYFFISRSE